MSYSIWLCRKRVIFFSTSQIFHFWNKVCEKRGKCIFLSHCVGLLLSLTEHCLVRYYPVNDGQGQLSKRTKAHHWILSPSSQPTSLKSILILCSHLRLGLPKDLFPSRILNAFLDSSMRTICPVRLTPKYGK